MSRFKNRVLSYIFALAIVGCSAMPLNSSMVTYADELLEQTNFDDGVGLPWHICETAPAKMDFEIADGVYKITIINSGGASKGGEDRWDCQFRHRDLKIEAGHTYTVQYTVTATNNCSIYCKIGDKDEPFTEDLAGTYNDYQMTWLTANQPMTVTTTFTANRTANVEWAFHIGGDSVPDGTVFTFDNMSLSDPQYTAPPKEEEWHRADILVNQVGYYPNYDKRATLLCSDTNSVEFYLKDSNGTTVYTGKSTYFGYDSDSGDTVHILDFSDFTTDGEYYLETKDGKKSWNFKIGTELYANMLYDSLNYFYQNRSGIAIESQYISSGDTNALARSAGHNPDNATTELTWGYTDSYSLDVTGGWYDAGDHGKYVVNGGISLWTMQNQYERAITLESVNADIYGDGSMNIPESGNGYPDLLDEARYELEFMFKMIVPDGYKYSGMVHHKIHDDKWTALATAPADDTKARILKPPTTTATLNLSACSAQAYRLWKDIDSTFADKCLEIAKSTYDKAKEFPNMYAPLDEAIGGGAYGDTDATDEFYWASCELYLATGDSKYYDDMKSSKYFLEVLTSLTGGEDIGTVGSMDWGNTASLGTLSLALVNGNLSSNDIATAKNSILSASDYYIDVENSQGYGIPLKQSEMLVSAGDNSTKITGYPWGSNSFVVNNAIVMAYAYDISQDSKYMNGVYSALDYILGRNPMDYSYVTGYGYHAVQNPHHRYWSHQTDKSFPSAPAGVLSGGANSGLQDPWVKGSGWKVGDRKPQLCYMDNIEAWSTNECTINWNSPLAWLTGFMTVDGNKDKVKATALNSTPNDNTNQTETTISTDSNTTIETQSQVDITQTMEQNDSNQDNNSTVENSNDAKTNSFGDIVMKIFAGIGALVVTGLAIVGGISIFKQLKK